MNQSPVRAAGTDKSRYSAQAVTYEADSIYIGKGSTIARGML